MPTTLFQSTRPRGARVGQQRHRGNHAGVSIHAPTRGATLLTMTIITIHLFQSTRPRGARRKIFFDVLNVLRVSIHAPTRGATSGDTFLFASSTVSIHAPTRGATHRKQQDQVKRKRFNPRAHAGRDNSTNSKTLRMSSFNPRAHAGRDVKRGYARLPENRFNPRAHAGRDNRSSMGFNYSFFVSIHAPTRGATATSFFTSIF